MYGTLSPGDIVNMNPMSHRSVLRSPSDTQLLAIFEIYRSNAIPTSYYGLLHMGHGVFFSSAPKREGNQLLAIPMLLCCSEPGCAGGT